MTATGGGSSRSPASLPPRQRSGRGSWLLLAFVGVSGAAALIARANLFPLMSGDADEPVYVYQGRMLAQGHVTLSAAARAEFFHPWLFGNHGGRLFS
jgi:hypothetical protein